MIVIADTSVLNYLIRLRQVSLLPSLYGRVTIAYAVFDEMTAGSAPTDVRSWALQSPEWMDTASADLGQSSLHPRLGAGERETIALASKLGADLVLMDDQAGRLVAEASGLHVAGTLAVLLQASRLGLVGFQAAFMKLKQLGFRVSPKLEIEINRLASTG